MFWTTRSFKSVLYDGFFCSFNAIFLKTKMGPPHSPRDPWLLVDQSALPFLGLRLSWYNLGDCYSVQSFDTCLSPEDRMILIGNITNNFSTAHLQDRWHLCPFDALTLLSLYLAFIFALIWRNLPLRATTWAPAPFPRCRVGPDSGCASHRTWGQEDHEDWCADYHLSFS